ncbi:HBR154Cp [Eremothecium sinecaudum]|uniref:HBR154Cp n=1 Tax=Eremothecium sinecaudum TaxID=45286 RepID=A0A109UX07_9SACH|nr:HBR154Cp [Eremothecium sinecaudum]AMD19055.1 HBR154Cp [Eremothecium sinecaudum]
MSLPSWCPQYNPTKYDPVTGQEVYCICKKPDNGELMALCDGCEDWFHFSCVKLPELYKNLVFSFYCPYCQDGITYNAQPGDPLPKTIWKRKCRLIECYKECAANSKYCSSEHGELYMTNMIKKMGGMHESVTGILKQMLKTENFESLGAKELPPADRQQDPELYDKLYGFDVRLKELEEQINELNEHKRPVIRARIDELNNYIAWLDDVNKNLFHEDYESGDEMASTKKKSKASKCKRKAKKKSICGYKQNHQIPTSAEEFASAYVEDESTAYSVCCKLRCIKHQDWANILLRSWNFELESIDNSEQRTQLLINVRKEQLAIQFHEALINKNNINAQ